MQIFYKTRVRRILVLAGYLAAASVAAIFGSYFTSKAVITASYSAMLKPDWAPPAWLFAPVWTLLYICMSWAMWLAWDAHKTQPKSGFFTAHAMWWTQLCINASWPLFFYMQPNGLMPVVVCVFLALLVFLCVKQFWHISHAASMLMLPYALWVSFASLLSYTIWSLN